MMMMMEIMMAKNLLVDTVPNADLAQLNIILFTKLHCLLRKLSQFRGG